MIKVLVVDDSPVVREYLRYLLDADGGVHVVGTARNGEEAVAFVQKHKPDVVTMDIDMPRMNGYEATRRIMETCPVPIVIATASWDRKAATASMQALQAGAVTAVGKPLGLGHADQASSAHAFVATVKLMSEVKVIRHWSRPRMMAAPVRVPQRRVADAQLVAVGSSTGGPPALQTLLKGLPRNFPVPIVIVQHISPGFTEGLADWLQESTGFDVHVGRQDERLLPGHVYVAPDHKHLMVVDAEHAVLSDEPPENGLRPAVSCLFRSVAKSLGERAVGVLLTGMGRDGARELKLMRDAGATTIAQDKESSVVHGMPGEAIAMGGAEHVLAPEEIAALLTTLLPGR